MNSEIGLKNEELTPQVPRRIEELLKEKECRLLAVKEIIFTDVQPPRIAKRSTKPIKAAGRPDRIGVQIDEYNESEPMEIGGQEIMLIREEPRSSEDSVVKFYAHHKEKDVWEPTEIPPMIGYQDPTYLGEIEDQKFFFRHQYAKRPKNRRDY